MSNKLYDALQYDDLCDKYSYAYIREPIEVTRPYLLFIILS